MDNEKIYQLLSGYMDDELKPDKKLKAIKMLESDPWCQEEYETLKNLKETLPSAFPEQTISPSFEANLKIKILEQENELKWFQRLFDSSMFQKFSYAAVAASIIFIAFLGFKIYLGDSEPLMASSQTDSQTDINQNGNQRFIGVSNYTENSFSPRIPASSSNEPIITIRRCPEKSRLLLSIKQGSNVLDFDLSTGKPLSKDYKNQLRRFNIKEDKIQQFRIYFNNNIPLFRNSK